MNENLILAAEIIGGLAIIWFVKVSIENYDWEHDTNIGNWVMGLILVAIILFNIVNRPETWLHDFAWIIAAVLGLTLFEIAYSIYRWRSFVEREREKDRIKHDQDQP